jgi:hypothetical protein
MTDINCSYAGNRDEMLVAHLYDDYSDSGAAERAAFDAHLLTCARCSADLAALGGVRQQLARWNPPEPNLQSTINPQPALRPAQGVLRPSKDAIRNPQWWRQLPLWAQVAAAMLFLGVSAGMANLDVRYDSGGLSVRTGWMSPQTVGRPTLPAPAAAVGLQNTANATPWRDDLAALERQLRSEIRVQPPAIQTRTVSDDARTRALIDESEKRQKRELALRVAEVLNDVTAQRQADLVNIDRNLGLIRNNTLSVDQQQRDLRNYVLRVSQQR